MSDEPLIITSIPTTKTAAFADQPISREDVLYLLQTARLAPSARNTQIWYFTVLTERAAIQRAAELAGAAHLAAASVVIAAQGKPGFWKKFQHEQPFLMIDVPIAMTHLSLAANERGLALEWVFAPQDKDFVEELALKESYSLVALGFLGHAAAAAPLHELSTTGVFRNEFRP